METGRILEEKNWEKSTGDDLVHEIGKNKAISIMENVNSQKEWEKNATNIFQVFIIHLTSNYWFIYLALLGADILSNNTTSNVLIIKNA